MHKFRCGSVPGPFYVSVLERENEYKKSRNQESFFSRCDFVELIAAVFLLFCEFSDMKTVNAVIGLPIARSIAFRAAALLKNS
jgi:hypothetical protein